MDSGCEVSCMQRNAMTVEADYFNQALETKQLIFEKCIGQAWVNL